MIYITHEPWPASSDVLAAAAAAGASQIVHDRSKPEGLVEDTPSLDEAKATKVAAINARRDACFHAGFSPTTGPLAGHALQIRDAGDRTNWLTSKDAYRDAVEAGRGDVRGAKIRTAANLTVPVTYAEGLSVLLSMAAWGAAVMENSWALKDAVDAAADVVSVGAVDIDEGWS